ncbi:MAG: CaiB/BaiF CoA-transferase family protein [Aliishimia sp.]
MGLDKELAGYLVVSVEQAVAAPYCSLLLADAGARVIKVERPEGDFARGYDTGADGQSAIFAWLNRGKDSVCLNLKDPNDMAVLRGALRKADVFVSNLAPGAVDRMGLSGDVLRRDNAGLITCSISGYGETGEAATKKAYDFLVQGESGICAVTGTKDAPARVGVSLTDLSTGLTAFSAILRGVLQRGRTGKGIDLKISMFDVMADWMNMPLMAHRYMGGAPERTGLTHSFVAPYGAFLCGDGGQVLLSVQNNREFSALCSEVLEQPDLAADPRFTQNPYRYANRVVLGEIITNAFARHTTPEVVAMLDGAKIANARMNSVADMSDHRFLRNTQAQIGDTHITLAALPVRTVDGDLTRVPDPGADTAAIRLEFGPKE